MVPPYRGSRRGRSVTGTQTTESQRMAASTTEATIVVPCVDCGDTPIPVSEVLRVWIVDAGPLCPPCGEDLSGAAGIRDA